MEMAREPCQRSASLEQDARRLRLAMEADVRKTTKTCKWTEGAAAAERVISGDNKSSAKVDPDSICRASIDEDYTGSAAYLCKRDDALVDNGATAPKPCISSAEMRTRTAAGGLLLAGTASTATRTTLGQSPLWFCPIEEINLRTSNHCATDYSSFWKMKVLQTKLMQILVFDPGGFKGRLRACPFSRT